MKTTGAPNETPVAPDGWAIERDASASMAVGQVVGAAALPLSFAAFAVLHAWLWGWPDLDVFVDETDLGMLAGIVAIMVLGVVAHEWLHKIGFVLRGAPWRGVQFGFDAKTLTPFARCNVPLPARAYRFAIGLPGVALGVVPALGGVAIAWWPLTVFGAFFTGGAVGDAMALWAIRGVGPAEFVLDHPSRIGCFVLRPAAAAPVDSRP